jgi:hypothetical protein
MLALVMESDAANAATIAIASTVFLMLEYFMVIPFNIFYRKIIAVLLEFSYLLAGHALAFLGQVG